MAEKIFSFAITLDSQNRISIRLAGNSAYFYGHYFSLNHLQVSLQRQWNLLQTIFVSVSIVAEFRQKIFFALTQSTFSIILAFIFELVKSFYCRSVFFCHIGIALTIVAVTILPTFVELTTTWIIFCSPAT